MTSDKIRELRENLGMTQDAFAEFCGVARISIARYESGGTPSRSAVERISKACGISIDYLLGHGDAQKNDDSNQMSDRMKRFMDKAKDLNDSEIELVSMFLEQVKKRRE